MPPDFGNTEQIVWYLMLPLLGKGYRLYVDNFYTSIRLFQTLFLHKTLACGTICSNRKEFPKQLVQQKLTLGQSPAMCHDKLPAVKFTDKKDVYMLSTIQYKYNSVQVSWRQPRRRRCSCRCRRLSDSRRRWTSTVNARVFSCSRVCGCVILRCRHRLPPGLVGCDRHVFRRARGCVRSPVDVC